ncbi:hypothetical protein BJ875DRAFT_502611 [Amylocarpus encephaloides]|uniref:Uncharacterized protein n=1 Tax=Amylocarpus encephaloides TaxID=45428 RepID=A0A9P8C9Z4_9HELO|nr:hypothetical protein BJ875DRAFT_502611 [Amylocarpus encephaloides]
MTTLEEKISPNANVLTITRPAASRQSSRQSSEVLSTIEDVDSAHSLALSRTAHSEKSAIMPQPSPFDSKQQIIESTNQFPDLESGLGRKQKLGIKIGVGFLVVAVIVVMCVLISKAVGGGVWSKSSPNAPIKGTG